MRIRIPRLGTIGQARDRQVVVLVKLAGIGDVAMACRALNDQFASTRGGFDLHWIIDKSLASLAKKLLKLPDDVTLNLHPIDTHALFQGSRAAQAKESFTMLRVVAELQPDCVAILHRDWRYRAILRPAYTGAMIQLPRQPMHEIDAYRISFARMLNKLGIPLGTPAPAPSQTHVRTGRIGVLVGGGTGTKVDFKEKRWPNLQKFIHELSKKQGITIELHGGPGDTPFAKVLLSELEHPKNIVDLTGAYDLDTIFDGLSGLDAFVSVDSGLAHIASMAMPEKGQRIVSLFGPTNSEIWSPLASGEASVSVIWKKAECAPCYHDDGKFVPCKWTDERNRFCMKTIEVQEVLDLLALD